MDEYKIFDQLNKCKGYDYAFLTTFNFEIGFFERSLLNILLGNDIKKVSLFVDQKEFAKSLEKTSYSSIGKRYIVNPVEMNKSFHPKIILLLGPAQAALFITSANLTTSGYYLNNEIFNEFIFDADHPETLNAINAAYSFFRKINGISYGLDNDLFKECDQLLYIGKSNDFDEPIIIENYNHSIISQIQKLITSVIKIDIAVPYYDNDLSALGRIKDIFPSAKINVYIQNNHCRVVEERLRKTIEPDSIFLFKDFYEHGTKNFYHGKVIRFITDKESFILYGSANCTSAALIKSFMEGGNIECDVLEKGNINTFDSFFDNFVFDERKMDCEPLRYFSESNSNYYFKYGRIEEEIELYIGYHQKNAITGINCNGNQLKWKYNNGDLVATLPTGTASDLGDIFDIEVKDNITTENVRCWYINPAILEINRNKELKGELYKVNLSSDDRFIEDRINIINVLSIGIAEVQKEKDIYDLVEHKEKDDEEDDESEGIVNYIIPSAEITEQYKKYEFAKTLKNSFITRYLGSFDQKKSDISTGDDYCKNASSALTFRKPTDDEKRFRSFVKSKIQIMNNPLYLEMVSFDHYLYCISVFIDIFDKYIIKERVQGMFDQSYVALSKMMFVNNLIDKTDNNDDKDDFQIVVMLGIETIIENIITMNDTMYGEETENYLRVEELLEKLDNHYHIRTNYHEFYNKAISKIELFFPKAGSICPPKRIEQLFRYKTIDQIIDIIQLDYGNETMVEYDDEIILIQTRTDVIKDYFKLKDNSYNEIRKYYKKSGNIRYIEILVENIQSRQKGDPPKYIRFIVDMHKGYYERIIERQSGKVETDNIKQSHWDWQNIYI